MHNLDHLITQKRAELNILEEARKRIQSLERLEKKETSTRITLEYDDVPF